MGFLFLKGDAGRIPLPDQSVQLVCGSPPYCEARTYLEDGKDLGIARECPEWIEWMLGVTAEALRVSSGAVIWVASGVTRDRTYQPACEGLMYRWWAEGWGDRGRGTYPEGSAYRPVYWNRNGIQGSGGNQWFRADVENCMAFKRPGSLPWTDNTACGHPPKYGPGGEMTNRMKNGKRCDERNWKHGDVVHPNRHDTQPDIANPGNLLKTVNGGGHLGSDYAHENEAPYAIEVPEFFIRSLCPPGGRVLDVFSGSGTTASAALKHDRAGIGMDLRMSQCRLGKRRIERPHAPVPKKSKPERKYAFLDFEED